MKRRVLLLAAAGLSVTSAMLTLGQSTDLPANSRGAVAAWEALLKLQTVASIMHTTAHPDDEQGELLALLGRGRGVRTALLTLTRGEAGDNAIGPELFDALGLLRTDELSIAGRYYGIDEQYFTAAADYGFSKRADEALTKWDRRALIGDMVRAIRSSRPLVVISRWQGTARDGHGQHQAAGLLTPEAVAAAADPQAFPELAREGLRPWRVRKVYSGGWQANEEWQVAIDPGVYNPPLGDSFTNVARTGLSLQRSQTAGRLTRTFGSTPLYYRRVNGSDAHERDFFDGLETSLSAAYQLLGGDEPDGASAQLRLIAEEANAALHAFRFTDPAAAAPAVARGLAATRDARRATANEAVAFLLQVKERQFEAALAATLGLELNAVAEPPGTTPPSGPYAEFAPPATLRAMTSGASLDIAATLVNQSETDVTVDDLSLSGAAGNQRIPIASAPLPSRRYGGRVTVTIPADTPVTRPYFSRRGIADSRYVLRQGSQPGSAWDPPAITAIARYRFNGVPSSLSAPVIRREAALPDGYRSEDVEILPPVSLSITPGVSVIRAEDPDGVAVDVDVTSFASTPLAGTVRIQAPDGWTVAPAAASITLQAVGDRQRSRFTMTPRTLGVSVVGFAAVFTTNGREWRTEYTPLRHRGLPLRYFVKDAAALASVVDLHVDKGVRVGYVMGIGDEVPAALEQLGARVTLLAEDDLGSGDLARFDTIVTGTRAYAIRDDLRRHNRRLLDWVSAGGNLVVLYNTPEFDPRQLAPYPATLPQDAEEVSEEDAVVTVLAPQHPLLSAPNRITAADFDGWVEQRGSKFFSTWDDRYTSLAESHDRDQLPQKGGWLTTTVGKGRWTYMAYALHRQLPYGVPGAYRLLANLIARR